MKAFHKPVLSVLGTLALVSGGATFVTSCEDGGMEEAGEEIDEAADDAADSIEDATDGH